MLEHIRKWKRSVNGLERLDEELKARIGKELFEALDAETRMKKDLKRNNDEFVTHRNLKLEV